MSRLGWLALLAAVLTGCPKPRPSAPPAPRAGAEPRLTVEAGARKRSWSRSELLAHPALERLTLTGPPGFENRTVEFRAVPVLALFSGLPVVAGDSIRYDTSDGFSASVAARQALDLDKKGASALVAVEPPEAPWPPLAGGKGSPGPFYLIWKHPEAARVGREEWPYQLRSLSVQPPPERLYPATVPARSLAPTDPARAGYGVFLKNCFPCHTLNRQGTAQLGPDLNWPHSPVEYLKEPYLRRLIRDPQSLRHWTGAKMTGFPKQALSDPELEQLLAYLRHMASKRPR